MKGLFITTQDINDKNGNGGVQCARRNYKLLKQYSRIEWNVCIIRKKNYCEDNISDIKIEQPKNQIGELLAAICGYKRIYPSDAHRIEKFVKEQKIDIVWIDMSLLGKLAFLRKYCKVVVFFHNCEYDFSVNKVKNEGIKYYLSAVASKHNEIAAAKADLMVGLNKRDSKRLEQLYGRGLDCMLPISFDDTYDKTRTGSFEQKQLLFVGSYFKPNSASIEWFIDNVMPHLKDYTLTIVGKGFECKKQEYQNKCSNVTVLGSVDNISEYYYKYPVIVMPILYGDGMKVKTAEAMMYGKTIFASDEALEGYDVDGVDGIYRCNTVDEYVSAIKSVFESDKEIPFCQTAVRECFCTKYTNASLYTVIKKCLDDLLLEGGK